MELIRYPRGKDFIKIQKKLRFKFYASVNIYNSHKKY